jgi:hypothetical protein
MSEAGDKVRDPALVGGPANRPRKLGVRRGRLLDEMLWCTNDSGSLGGLIWLAFDRSVRI